MNSSTAPEFWEWFGRLSAEQQKRVRKAYRLWRSNPRHPSLRFKKVGRLWSVRVTDAMRALGVDKDGVIVWFYVGPHDRYERKI
ncbi:MAG: hypothetical protein ACJ8LI_10470 [Chthoniobacterales bacterium]